jgi:carbon-monoxide dehydrogenase medium subunit
MKPPKFDYHAPRSVDEAVALLARYGGDAKPLAGGQSLVPLLNFRLARPAALIDLNRIPALMGIREVDGHVVFGAMTRQRAVEFSPVVARTLPLLAEATRWVGHLPIRSRGTIGGSIAHADPSAEYPAVLAALDGTVIARGQKGERELTSAALFETYLTTTLAPDELLTEVRLPALPEGCGTAFVELSRRHGDFALVGVAAMVAPGDVRVALTGVDGAPVLRRFDDDSPDIGREVATPLDPPADLHATAAYRRRVAAVLVDRALALARSRAA